MNVYTIEVVTEKMIMRNMEFWDFLKESAEHLDEIGGHRYNWREFPILAYIENHRVTVCRRDGKLVGVMLARLCNSNFDRDLKVLRQDILYCRPGTRAAKLLLEDFIDFGKANAKHVITAIGKRTNIKGRSLEKLGFKELETLYRLEV